ncbi:MAG: hypothetical protein ACC700_20105 [Anaerolineales bacterium]
MTTIRVDPEELIEAAETLNDLADDLERLAEQVLGAADMSPSYDGQFGPKVSSIAAEAFAAIQANSTRLDEAGSELHVIGEGFLAADAESVEGFRGLGEQIRELLEDIFARSETVLSPLLTWLMTPVRDRSTLAPATPKPPPALTPTPSPVPTPGPTVTPSAVEMQKQADEIAARQVELEGERRRIEEEESQRRQKALEDAWFQEDPLGFALWEGDDYYEKLLAKYDTSIEELVTAERPRDNPVKDSEIYPGMAPVTIMNKDDEAANQFLFQLGLRTDHYPNFDPIYLERLKAEYPNEYSQIAANVEEQVAGGALDAVFSEEFYNFIKRLPPYGYE